MSDAEIKLHLIKLIDNQPVETLRDWYNQLLYWQSN